jgi:hypothetical protein
MAFQTIGTGSLRMRTVGRQGMRRPSAMRGVCNVFRPGAAAHGWRALPFPLAPFLAHTGSGRVTWGAGANAWWPAHAMVGYARYEPHATSGFLIRL